MFLNTIHSERIKAGLKRNINYCLFRHDIGIPRRGPYYTGNMSMGTALELLQHFFIYQFGGGFYVGDFINFQLALLYQAATDIVQDQGLNGNGIDIMQRFCFVLAHMHTVHHSDVIFPSQWQYIFQRRLAVAMALHARLGSDSGMYLLESDITRSFALQSLHEADENVKNIGGFEVLKDRWEDFFLNEGRL
jgi:hypothetical protein